MSIFEKLLSVQTKLNAPKTQFNKFGGYSYRNCEDILAALKPLLLKEKLVVIISDNLEQIGNRYYIKAVAKLIDLEDNSEISVTAFAREEESKKGMDGSQVTGASSSYARKYALNGLFGIDDTKDSDTTNTGYKPKGELTNKQINHLYSIAKSKGHGKEKVDNGVLKKFGKAVNELTKEEYETICNGYENMK